MKPKEETCSCLFCERLKHLIQVRYVMRIRTDLELKWAYDEIINRLLDMVEAEGECDFLYPYE